MIKQVTVTTIGVGYGDEFVTKRRYRQIIGQTLMQVVKHWHQKYLPFHFEPFATAKYGYIGRGVKYERRKKALAARGVIPAPPAPLVFRGRMRSTMMSGIRVSYSGKQAAGTMTGPPYLHMYSQYGRGPRKNQEVIKHTSGELTAQARLAHELMVKQINEDRVQATVIIA